MAFIVEADGGSRGNPGPAGFGAVVRAADTGAVIAEIADGCGITTNNVAEYSGLIAGLEACRRLDAHAEVHVRMDSKLVIEQMSGRWAIKNESMRELAQRARALLPPQVSWTWIPRAENSHADRLANLAMDAQEAGGNPRIERFGENPVPVDVIGEVGITAGAQGTGRATNRIVGWTSGAMTPCTFLLVRHGVTWMSLEKRFSGRGGIDPALAEMGRAQAEAVAAELMERGGADLVVTSSLARAKETGSIISARLGYGGAVHVVDDLDEAAFGEWDALTFSDVREQWPEHLEAWLASPEVAPPGGESLAAVRRRVSAALRALAAANPGRRIVVVAHVTPIKVWVQEVLEAPLGSAFRMELAPCSITTVASYPDGVTSMFGFGESAHLRQVPVVPGT